MSWGKKHADHDYIVARQERYTTAWSTGSVEEVMKFMHKQDYSLSFFGLEQEGLDHSEARAHFESGFRNFHKIKLETRSLHGHKHFTAWEWTMTCVPLLGPGGKKLEASEVSPKKLAGCTLAWWDNDDKIIRNHEYAQVLNG